MIHIVCDGVESDVDETRLQRFESTTETEESIVRTVEYCWTTCDGQAHDTRIPDSTSHFCHYHVHRSLYVDVKRWPAEMGALAGGFGS